MITQGPVPLIYPGPALPNLQVGTISATEVEELLKGRPGGPRHPAVADAPTTRFTVLGDNGVEELEVYALAESGGRRPGSPPSSGRSGRRCGSSPTR